MKLAQSRLIKRKQKKLKQINTVVISILVVATLWAIDFGYLINYQGAPNLYNHKKPMIDQVQAKEQIIEPEYKLSSATIKIINNNPTVAGAINKHFGKEWRKWSELIARESSFKPDAINPTSGACGLGQSLPCSKMQCSLDINGIECQIEWVENYVANRYGTIDKALAFWDTKKQECLDKQALGIIDQNKRCGGWY
jgi:hypothetical protein